MPITILPCENDVSARNFLKKNNQKIQALLQIHFIISTLPPTTMSTTVTQDKYQAVREDIIKVFPKEDYDDGSLAPVM